MHDWIGFNVVKKSGRPFKSGNKVATVESLIIHPITKRTAFTFTEDDSYVECRVCRLKEDNE